MNRLRSGEMSGIYALNGMGGVGKTALAAEIVGRLFQEREIFPGGAVWIFCEGLEGPNGLIEIWRQIAFAMRLEQVVRMTDTDALRIALITRLIQSPRILLALDNVEPKLDAEILLNTLAVTDHTTILLTARQALVPEKLTSIMLRPLRVFDASQLFIQRLKQIDDDRPTRDDNIQISQIIEALGGLPLAIELVAAYAGVQRLPLTHILRELEQDKLEASSLNFDPRRTLRSRFNRSWTVLTLQEQQLFASLALLKGTVFPRSNVIALAEILDWKKEARFSHLKDVVPTSAFIARHNSDMTANKYKQYAEQKAKQAVAKLVTYALVEPVGLQYLRLHPLLREYADERLQELPFDISENLQKRATAYAMQQGSIWSYPSSYVGLTEIEAVDVWEIYQDINT